ncbi:MAG TPA: choice-of-anchor tandem repeat GloVer-containing protein [Chthonomonadaceae bacterium]|nr:choice-of-anchor tandem repeat GloVer-containing protein [Chthonomonadaceae bacterium]
MTTLWQFQGNVFNGGTNGDGAGPVAPLIAQAPGGPYYGTTYHGGTQGLGSVYMIGPAPTYTESVIHSFGSGSDGAICYGGVIQDSAGNLYGTTGFGGAYNKGLVYELDYGTWTEHVLYTFTGGADGGGPECCLVFGPDGQLYGTTSGGGAGYGTVFALTPPSTGFYTYPWTETVLYTFTGGADGAFPFAGVIFAGNSLCGTAVLGGAPSTTYPNGAGVVYQLQYNWTSASWVETVLHTFTGGADGALPQAGLTLDANVSTSTMVYGAARTGGVTSIGTTGQGVVFSVGTQSPYAFTVLHTFLGAPKDGADPTGTLVVAGNYLYGTTYEGRRKYGSLYKVKPAGAPPYGYLNFYAFTGTLDGGQPSAGLLFDGLTLYGTTRYGGAINEGSPSNPQGYGTFFRYP